MIATAQLPNARLETLGARFRALATEAALIPETSARDPRVLKAEQRVTEIQSEIQADRRLMQRGVLRLSFFARFFFRLNHPASQATSYAPAASPQPRPTTGRSK